LVLCIARQGIHINRYESPAGNKRQAVHVFLLIWFP
jgi:hypothetical protein